MELTFDDEQPTRPNRRLTVRVLLGAAVIPWLIILIIMAGQPNKPTAAPASELEYTEASAETSEPRAPQQIVVEPTPSVDYHGVQTSQHGSFVHPEHTQVAAYALIIARNFLHEVVLRSSTQNIEQIAIEQIDTTSDALTVATVLANIRAADQLLLVRVAVPLTIDEAGDAFSLEPYLLPNLPSIDVVDLDGLHPVTTVTPIYDALRVAGYSDVTVHSAATATGWPVLAAVTIDDYSAPYETILVLHDTGNGLSLAGKPQLPRITGPTGLVNR